MFALTMNSICCFVKMITFSMKPSRIVSFHQILTVEEKWQQHPVQVFQVLNVQMVLYSNVIQLPVSVIYFKFLNYILIITTKGNKFILCFAGIPIERSCSPGLYWNIQYSRCVRRPDSDCVTDVNVCPISNDPNDIVIVPNDEDCQTYFICYGNISSN